MDRRLELYGNKYLENLNVNLCLKIHDKNKRMKVIILSETIVLKPGPTRRVDLGLEPGRVEEKIEEGKTQRDPTDPAG